MKFPNPFVKAVSPLNRMPYLPSGTSPVMGTARAGSEKRTKHTILMVAPLPPPYAGPEVMTELLLRSSLQDRFHVVHVCNNLHSANRQKGRIGLGALARFAVVCGRTARKVAWERPQLTYTLLSQNRSGFVRDVAVFFLLKLFRKRIVWHFYGANFHSFYQSSNGTARWLIHYLLANADALVVLSESIAKRFQTLSPRAPIRIVPNAVDPCHLPSNFSALTSKRAGPGQPANVLFIGSLSQAKGFGDLLQAVSLVLARAPTTRFFFAGDLILRERNIVRDENGVLLPRVPLRLLMATMQARFPQNVHFLGVVESEHKWRLYSNADIFVLPTYSEGLPLVVLEAMAAGLPVVTTPVGAMQDVFCEGVHVRFVTPGEPEALAAGLLGLIEHPEERRRMGKTNFDYVRHAFAPEQAAAALATVFEEVLARHHEASGIELLNEKNER